MWHWKYEINKLVKQILTHFVGIHHRASLTRIERTTLTNTHKNDKNQQQFHILELNMYQMRIPLKLNLFVLIYVLY